jgi:XTP/dITP diphosphohydrolase
LRRSLLIGLSLRKAGKQEKKMDLLLATRNAHKAREFRELLGNEFKVSDLSALPEIALPEETGRTFEENAILKAVAVSQLRQPSRAEDRQVQDRHLHVLADDSGLEVEALSGAPGIFSARYASQRATDKQNVDKLLRELERIGALEAFRRRARFRCALALARNGKLLSTFEGIIDGTIVDLPRGSGGFGYDPVFVPNGFDKTFGELRPELKNQISHRARAVRELCVALQLGETTQGFGGGGGAPGEAPG